MKRKSFEQWAWDTYGYQWYNSGLLETDPIPDYARENLYEIRKGLAEYGVFAPSKTIFCLWAMYSEVVIAGWIAATPSNIEFAAKYIRRQWNEYNREVALK